MNKPDIVKIPKFIAGWTLGQRILATLAYFDIFDLALGEDDFRRLLLGDVVSAELLRRELEKLGNKVVRKDGKTALAGREKLLEIHEKQKRKSFDLYKKADRWAWVFRYLPFVELVAVCNYLPLGVVDECSDIDIFVVTKRGRIFLARVIMTVWLHLLGLRRHEGKVRERFCLSFYVSEAALDMKELLFDNDIYFAYWMIALYPVYGEHKVWEDLQKENHSWVAEYLMGGRLINRVFANGKNFSGNLYEWMLGGRVGNYLESKFRKFFQKRNARRKDLPDNASILIDEKRLKYHNNDRREMFRDEWLLRLKGFGLLE